MKPDDAISREALKKHKFTTQIANGVANEEIEVVPLCEIDNAPPVQQSILPLSSEADNAYMRGYEVGKAEGILRANKRPKGEWIPMNPDCRGYSDYFKCSICGAYIYPRNAEKELDYNGCPYCFADMRPEDCKGCFHYAHDEDIPYCELGNSIQERCNKFRE